MIIKYVHSWTAPIFHLHKYCCKFKQCLSSLLIVDNAALYYNLVGIDGPNKSAYYIRNKESQHVHNTHKIQLTVKKYIGIIRKLKAIFHKMCVWINIS